jgi:hypothetical protein
MQRERRRDRFTTKEWFMRKSKFSETQVVGVLKDAENGVPVADLLRKHGVSKVTFFKVAQQIRWGVGIGCEAATGARSASVDI